MRSIIEEFNIRKNIRNYVIKRTIANAVDDNKVAMGAAGATAAGLGAYGLYRYIKNKKDVKNHENQRSLTP